MSDIKIERINVILTNGPDSVYIKTAEEYDVPFPDIPEKSLSLYFECVANTGIEYVKKNFNIEPFVLDTRI